MLKKSIIAYNLELHEKSLSDGSYRGEEGILRISPAVARSFGLKVLMDQDYIEARGLFKKAEELFEQTVEVMETQKKEKVPGGHAQRVGEGALVYNKVLQFARERLMAYRSKLNPSSDERLNEHICSALLGRLLEESLVKTSYNLRDALGYFYNQCQDSNEESAPLTPQNMEFVNGVFRKFTEEASDKTIQQFDFDKNDRNGGANPSSAWKHIVEEAGSPYTSLLESVFEGHKKAGYPVDILLFLALIKQESNYNPQAVSHVGAVGLTQIMPKTAKNLGMKNIFVPPYFDKAKSLMGREQKLRRRAIALISEITEENKVEYAKLARRLMQKSLLCNEKRAKLFARYKQELLKRNRDDRLDPHKAIEYGLKYFSTMMKRQKGDISLALASYNAGPSRVKQYKGIPPYRETISFRNGVLKYYRDYLRKLDN